MYILFDIGGTKTRIAVSTDGKGFRDPHIFPTPQSYEEGIQTITAHIHDLLQGARLEAIAGGIPGPLDEAHTTLVRAPHLAGWVGKSLKHDLEKTFRVPVFLENDAAVVGLGEAVHGAGRGHEIVAYITVSTGVGGVRVVDGLIDKSAFGFEIGHQVIDIHGEMCAACDVPGHLETYISGSSLEKKYHVLPTSIEDPRVWDEVARILAYGLNNTTVYWSPHIIILGGAIMRNNPIDLFGRVKEYFKESTRIFSRLPHLERASLGDVGGLHGSLELLRQKRSRTSSSFS